MKQNLFAAAVIVFLYSFTIPLNKTDVKLTPASSSYTFSVPGTAGMPEMNLEESSAVY